MTYRLLVLTEGEGRHGSVSGESNGGLGAIRKDALLSSSVSTSLLERGRGEGAVQPQAKAVQVHVQDETHEAAALRPLSSRPIGEPSSPPKGSALSSPPACSTPEQLCLEAA